MAVLALPAASATAQPCHHHPVRHAQDTLVTMMKREVHRAAMMTHPAESKAQATSVTTAPSASRVKPTLEIEVNALLLASMGAAAALPSSPHGADLPHACPLQMHQHLQAAAAGRHPGCR
jgi:hypothetical protein